MYLCLGDQIFCYLQFLTNFPAKKAGFLLQLYPKTNFNFIFTSLKN